MIVLGVAFLSDASACVLKDGVVLSAVSEERLNRVKLWHGVPHAAILKASLIAAWEQYATENDVVDHQGHFDAIYREAYGN